MVYAIKRFNCTTAVLALMKYCEEFKDPRAGFPNGLDDIKNRALMVSETEAVLQRESEEAPPSTWLRKSSLSGMNWRLIKPAGLLSPELEQRPFTGNLKEGDSKISLLFPLYPEYSFVMARRIKKNQKETTAINLIHIAMLKKWAICNRQTLWAPGISEGLTELSASILLTQLMWPGIQLLQASAQINKPFLCAGIWLKLGDIWAFLGYLRWTMKWLLRAEGAISSVSLNLFDCICFLEFIWSLSRKESREETLLSKASTRSGKKECSRDIIVQPLVLLEEPTRDSFSIIIMGSPIEGLPQKKMVQDSPVYLKIKYGNLSGICLIIFVLKHILILKGISNCLLRREKSPLLEKLIPMGESKSMGFLTLLEKNWKDNMLLLLYLLIAKNLLLRMRMRLSNLLLSRLKIKLLIQHLNSREVHDVMSTQSIKKRFTML